jgi:MFS family permease
VVKLHKNIKLLSWFNFLLDFRFYSPIAIIYFTKVSGSFALGMSIFSITMLSNAIFEVPTGIYSDIIGRKKTLVWGATMSLLSVIFYALGGSFVVLAIGGIIEGIARAFYSGNNEAFLVDSLAESNQQEEYAQYLGTTSSMFQWALAISALVGGIFASISFPLVMWLSVIPAIIGLLVSLKMVEPKIHKEKTTNIYVHLKESISYFKSNYKLRTLSISDIIGYAQEEAGYQFRSAFVNTLWPIWAVGLAKMLSNIGAALSFHFSGKFIKRHKSLPILLGGKIYSLLSNIIATVFPTVFSPLLLSSNSLFFGTGTVAMSDLLQKEYSAHQRSTMGSLNSLFGSVAFAIVAFGLGLFADLIGPAKALLSLQVLAVVSLFLIWRLFKNKG